MSRQVTYSDDPNSMKIGCREIISLTPFMPMRKRIGMAIEISGYNLEEILAFMLEDYSKDKILETLNRLEPDTL